ncbi:DUF503 family protein [Candidatus Desulfovibrio trichonymphae]|uniref:DUF503 family protein n=1 Tax=Candidatus Desulfovibrio trichonymphae TaxID=1725232 RepID=UPI001E319913|nr:DUF503 family protein [Candidatus Desulfovibrio trichonymphae]
MEFSLDGNKLKAKRQLTNNLKQKIRNRFNAAIVEAEIEESLTLANWPLSLFPQRSSFIKPYGQVRDDGSAWKHHP